MQTVFDIGMFDGADTGYYLASGFRVVAVEANPALIARAQSEYGEAIRSKQLHLRHAAIGPAGTRVTLNICGEDAGKSSLYREKVIDHQLLASVEVQAIELRELIEEFGVPHFMKVDIEGADRLAVLGLTPETAPRYLSYEVGSDLIELTEHAQRVGYTRFKIINQNNFLEIREQHRLYDRVVLRLLREAGYDAPQRVRRAGRFFRVGHSAGPAPWESGGRWSSAQEMLACWPGLKHPGCWYDVHAVRGD